MRAFTIFAMTTLIISLLVGCGGGGGSHGSAATPDNQTGTNAPTLTIEIPTTDSSYLSSNDTIDLSGSASDDSAVVEVEWSTNTGFSGQAAGQDQWSVSAIPLQEGDTEITLTARDDSGQAAHRKIMVTYNKYLLFHGTPEVTPFAIFTNEDTEVITRIAILPSQNLMEETVMLLKVDAAGKTIQELGRMYDDGDLAHGDDIKGDGVFSAKTDFLEPQAGECHLRVTATTQETSGMVDAFTHLFGLSVVDPIADTVVSAAVSLQEEAQQRFNDDAATLSKNQALINTRSWLKNQAGVKSAHVTESGDLWVEFDSGLDGIVLCGEEGEEGGSEVMAPANKRGSLASLIPLKEQTVGSVPMMAGNAAPKAQDPNVVLNTKAFLYAPFHTQFSGWGTEFLDSLKTRLDNAEKPKFKPVYLKNSGADVASLATLTGYGLIVFHTHGGTDNKGNVILSTGEKYSVASFKAHALKFLTHQLTLATIHGTTYWAFLPKLVKKTSGVFPNSIIYAGACSSSKTKTMANAFIGKKANTYFGFNNTVYGSFDKKMADQLFPRLIDQNKTTGESFTANQHDSHTVPAYFTMDGNKKAYFKVGLVNGDFEAGALTGWTANGDGRVISKLGYMSPWENGFMGIISTGLGYTTSSGSISQSFWVDPDNTTLTLKWNFLSEEFMEWVGSQYQDYFKINIIDENGVSHTIFHKTIDDIANGYSLTQVSPDIVFDKGDVYATGWVFFQYSLLQWADQYVTIECQCGDVGDSIYDTAILLDAIVAGEQ